MRRKFAMTRFLFALLSVGLFFSISEAAVSGQQKKSMSTFLSNFTEIGLMNFSAKDILDPKDPADVIKFGIQHNDLNNFKRKSLCKDKECPHGALTIGAKFVGESIERYFGFKFKAHKTVSKDEHIYFYDGKLYHFDISDEPETFLARVKDAKLANGVWTATGEIYDAHDEQKDTIGTFTAKFKPHKWNGKDTYSIVSMETENLGEELLK